MGCRKNVCSMFKMEFVIPFLYGGIVFFSSVLLISIWMDMNVKSGQCHLFSYTLSSRHGPEQLAEESTEKRECNLLIMDGFISMFLGFGLLVWSAISLQQNLHRWINTHLIVSAFGALFQLIMSLILTTTMMYYCWNLEEGTTIHGCTAAARRYDQEAATSHMLGMARSTVAHMSMSSLASWSIFMTWLSVLVCVLVRRHTLREAEKAEPPGMDVDYFRVSNKEVPDVSSADHPWKRIPYQQQDENDEHVIFSASLYSPWDKDDAPLVL